MRWVLSVLHRYILALARTKYGFAHPHTPGANAPQKPAQIAHFLLTAIHIGVYVLTSRSGAQIEPVNTKSGLHAGICSNRPNAIAIFI
jgi:hypothetical protein